MTDSYRPPGNFSSELLRKIEKEGRQIYEQASTMPGFDKIADEFRAYVLKQQATKYVQICINRVWQVGVQTSIKAFRMRNKIDLEAATTNPEQEAIAETIMQEEYDNARHAVIDHTGSTRSYYNGPQNSDFGS